MPTRVLVIGGALTAQIVLIAGLLWVMERDGRAPTATAAPRPGLDRALTPQVDVLSGRPRVRLAGAGWRLVDQLSAHFALVLKVEAENLSDAKSIAQRLTGPVTDSYTEVLVYFYPTGGKNGLPDRRVQWTEAGGYVEMSLRP